MHSYGPLLPLYATPFTGKEPIAARMCTKCGYLELLYIQPSIELIDVPFSVPQGESCTDQPPTPPDALGYTPAPNA